jgi:hypothetical protein
VPDELLAEIDEDRKTPRRAMSRSELDDEIAKVDIALMALRSHDFAPVPPLDTLIPISRLTRPLAIRALSRYRERLARL